MNLTNRVYLAVHLALTVLVCARSSQVAHWPWYVAWNVMAMAAILVFAGKQHNSSRWEFVHDWLPGLFFITVFEEVSFLSLGLRGAWQNAYLVRWEAALFAVPPAEWLHRYSSLWFRELLEFGYFSFYPLYPAVAGVLWAWRRRSRYAGAFRSMTDGLSVGYAVCYATYLLFPTRSPAHNVRLAASALPVVESSGPFHFLVRLIQNNAGVHGNAFPSGHIMLGFAVLVFVVRYFPRFAPWLAVCVVLMSIGAVYDGYHYAIDVVAGAALGLAVGAAFVGRRTISNQLV
ncbi:MAG TPA: phosphatase PAP2 family protein [Terriglobales bacterium]